MPLGKPADKIQPGQGKAVGVILSPPVSGLCSLPWQGEGQAGAPSPGPGRPRQDVKKIFSKQPRGRLGLALRRLPGFVERLRAAPPPPILGHNRASSLTVRVLSSSSSPAQQPKHLEFVPRRRGTAHAGPHSLVYKPNLSILPRGVVDTRDSEHSVVLPLWRGSWELAVGAEGDYRTSLSRLALAGLWRGMCLAGGS